MSADLSILNREPFAVPQTEKVPLFRAAMRQAVAWHFQHSSHFQDLCRSVHFDPAGDWKIEDLPYFPVTMFKTADLLSIPPDQIARTLFSSSTSGQPSKIMIDQVTANRQVLALNHIMRSYFGNERRVFFIFDTPTVIQSTDGELSSRGTAIRGLLSMASTVHFLLRDDLTIDPKLLATAQAAMSATTGPLMFFGFTWLLYSVFDREKDSTGVQSFVAGRGDRDAKVLHIGGWKKLQDLAVSKPEFNQRIANWLRVDPRQVVDFYGMTEQLGTVYPDCPAGHKHLPLYSELIIRDPGTLGSVPIGQTGLIQLLSPIPSSYPGISILSDDLGRIVGIDDCPCGRQGKYFVFEKRSEKAELKGCGDTLQVVMK